MAGRPFAPRPPRPRLAIRFHDGERLVEEIGPGSDGSMFATRALWTALPTPGGATAAWQVELDITARRALTAGVTVALRLGPIREPGWLIPGLFYGANGPPDSRVRYPLFAAAADGRDPFVAAGWSFRADRTATPAVFGWDAEGGAALATAETGPLGLMGVGFASLPEATEIRLHVPYREEPVAYDGRPEPDPPDRPAHTFAADETVRLVFRAYLLPADRLFPTGVLRDLAAWLAPPDRVDPPVTVDQAARLAAEGLLRWHFDPDTGLIYETAAFDRPNHEQAGRAEGDRRQMHVAWLSGAPPAFALLRHGRRTGDDQSVAAGRAVLDAITANLAPCGSFWGQWTAGVGWGKGWTPGRDRLHSRTIGEAALFVARSIALDEGAPSASTWRAALVSNLRFVARLQRPDGAIPASWDGRTGEAADWQGTAGLAWIPPFVRGSAILGEPAFLDAARRAGAFYRPAVEAGELCGAPEDTDRAPTSEDGYLAVMAYLALAGVEPSALEAGRWRDLARAAADWTLSFRYTFDVAFPPGSTLARHGFRTRGADMASPVNQHLHAYGLICHPEMVRLAALTGDAWYRERAEETLACFRQTIARHDGDLGARRGMTPERYYQTAYGGPKGEIDRLSHAWCLGLLLHACEAAIEAGDG
jgi:hypothetical protein